MQQRKLGMGQRHAFPCQGSASNLAEHVLVGQVLSSSCRLLWWLRWSRVRLFEHGAQPLVLPAKLGDLVFPLPDFVLELPNFLAGAYDLGANLRLAADTVRSVFSSSRVSAASRSAASADWLGMVELNQSALGSGQGLRLGLGPWIILGGFRG